MAVTRNHPLAPITYDSDVDIYLHTMCWSSLSHLTGTYYLIEQSYLFAVSTSVKNIRFHWRYCPKPQDQYMTFVITPHIPSTFPEHEPKRKTKEPQCRNHDRSSFLEHDSEPPA